MLNSILLVICLVILGSGVLYILKRSYDDLKRERIVKNFVAYSTVLDYHLERAYELVHKDKILIYSLEATTLPDKEFNEYSKVFLRLAQKIMGPSLLKEFEFFYGDYDTLVFNMVEYFNTKYENDEIRKNSMSNLMEEENTEGLQ